MAEYKDYYKILGVGKNATEAEVKKAFKTQARKFHPDMHPEGKKHEMTEKFKDINEAYAVLSDKQKRTIYDQVGQEGYQQYERGGGASSGARGRGGSNPYQQYQQYGDFGGTSAGQSYNFGGSGGQGADFSDFFQSIFGGGFGGMGGGNFGGMGGGNFAGAAPGGQGAGDSQAELTLNLEDAFHGGKMQLTLPNGRNVAVNLPAGVGEGKQIKLKGMGNPGKRGTGDLYLTIKIRPHLTYRLEGDDLHVPVTLMPWTAALGGAIFVPTLGGPVKVKIPAGTHTGKKLKLSGKGLNAKGNLYVTLTIDVPHTLTKAQKDLFTKLQDLG